jgi:hypothetical protein
MLQLITTTSGSGLVMPPFRCQYQAVVMNRLDKTSRTTVCMVQFFPVCGRRRSSWLGGDCRPPLLARSDALSGFRLWDQDLMSVACCGGISSAG